MKRRSFSLMALALGSLAVSSCGFKLRGSFDFAFKNLLIQSEQGSVVTRLLKANLDSDNKVKVLVNQAFVEDSANNEAVLNIISERREKSTTALNSSGQISEFQLRFRVIYEIKNAAGKLIVSETQIVAQRDFSYSETQALGKQAEEALLYRDLEDDVVQQLLRRLSSIKSLNATLPS
jgi:LPS-assembly lipoprotein